jgi:hypothetical protein
MAREITLDDLMRKQETIARRASEMYKEKDTERLQRLVNELTVETRELEKLAKDFERQELAKAGPPPRGSIEIVLTDEQRARVEKLTGVRLDTISLRDESGVLNQAMPYTDPQRIELLAIAEARRRKEAQSSNTVAREQVNKAIEDIEQQGTGQVRDMLNELRADPNWLGGLAKKK